MQNNVRNDQDFTLLTDFLFSFSFPNKEQIKEYMRTASMQKEQSEYHIVFHFEATKDCISLPDACNGMPVFIQVKNSDSLTCCELFVSKNHLKEYRVYNIDNSKLNIGMIHSGKAILEIRQQNNDY